MTTVKTRYSLMLLLIAFFIQSCGFQLRGALEISQDVSPFYLQQNSAFELAREIRLLLVTNKVMVTDNSSEAKSRLVLLKEDRHSRVLSVDGAGRAREYLLTYTVTFILKFDKHDGVQTKDIPELISVSRNLLFDTTAVLAVTNESDILYEDMRRDVARLILQKLQARSANKSSGGNSAVDDPGAAQTDNSAESQAVKK